MRINELFEAASIKYVFINPKNKGKEYSGEYLAIAQNDVTPANKYLKKIKAGIYSHKELIKKSGLGGSISVLVDQLSYEYDIPELSTGRVVEVKNGELEFKTHMHKKVKINKQFTAWMIKNGYLVIDTE